MKSSDQKEDWKALEEQLYCPSGDMGLKVGEQLHQSNIGMTLASIGAMDLNSGEFVLELGHANCSHLADLLAQAEDLQFWGLEISALMKAEAERINQFYVERGIANFALYDGVKLPYEESRFHKIFTVNSIYFWPDPVGFLDQLYELLLLGGCCVISFVWKEVMLDLPFVGEHFRLYDKEDILALIEASKFEEFQVLHCEERVLSKVKKKIDRQYGIVKLYKP